ncbi:small-conductance mechanosensitive channel [Evansella vedderi]|uniref:Small-conductance mechanosensitive channel n=1 Tax=Evansella vedderi TaxID=38282 RepID=A0ABU0A389_9BACI|nr:small-conductance mechanosensitive channel [Evansella vedderi]
MELFDWFELIFSLVLLFIILSPLIFSKIQKKSTEFIGWKGIVKSRWFGIPLIFLLLFSYFGFLNLATAIAFSIVVSLCISVIANTLAYILNKRKSY